MKLKGKVSTIIYKSQSNDYTVMQIRVALNYITVVGSTYEINVGDEIELDGEYDKHKDYGEQFKFTTCTKIMPSDNVALIQYIADNIKGIGKKTASNIVEHFGDETINIIRYSPKDLKVIRGLTEQKAEYLSEYFNTEWTKWNTIAYLTKFNIPMATANKIFKTLGEDTVDIIKKNPYSILDFSKILTFEMIDEIGQKSGIALDNSERICCGIIYSLSKIIGFGHTCVEKYNLIDYASKILKVEKDIILNNLTLAQINKKIYIEEIEGTEFVFETSLYLAEKNIAEQITFHTMQENTKVDYSRVIKDVSKDNELTLSQEQSKAIATSLNSKISIITGGPGTGKTTIIKCITDILEIMDKTYMLCAPTGRAAKRITETTGKKAKTLHRLLEISQVNDQDLNTYLNYEVKTVESDVVIVDEASMIDCLMMNNLLKAIKGDTQIIFVGDVNQLPSVGSGNVLKDIIDSNIVNVVYLNEIYRQSSQSDIIINAHRVNNGEYLSFKNNDTDMYFIKTNSIEDTVSEISSLLAYRLENYADLNIINDSQILTPMKKTELGTIALNKVIQDILNPKSKGKNQKEFNGKVFRVGDKVMQMVNNYDKKYKYDDRDGKGVYNGDIGYIKSIDNSFEYIIVKFEDEKEIEYTFEELEELEHAYAITVHKSQGSEFDYVIMPIYSGYSKLFTRNLLYTAMTRAKKMLIIVGSRTMLNYMVDNVKENDRKTGLKHKLRNMI